MHGKPRPCGQEKKYDRNNVGLGSAHVHMDPRLKNWWDKPILDIRLGEWLVQASDGSFIKVMSDEEFRATYEEVTG